MLILSYVFRCISQRHVYNFSLATMFPAGMWAVCGDSEEGLAARHGIDGSSEIAYSEDTG
jgi:hypothetical protein